MNGSKPWQALCGLLALVLVGCQAPVSSTSSERQVLRPLQEAWRPDLLFVRAQPYPRLVLQVDAVQGCEPSPETLSALRDFLVRHVDKPGGVEVVVNPLIPPADARRMRLNQLLLSTVDVPTDGNVARQDTATIRILCYDSRQLRGKSDEGLQPHSNALPYPAQIYFDRAYWPSVSRRMERAVLQHELGHVLGLVGDLARGDGAHCRNRACLMWPEVSASIFRELTFRKDVVGPRQLCAECEADLARSRASTADAHARFVGPALVRDADGYASVGIPGGGVLCVGPLNTNTVADLIEHARAAAAAADYDVITGSVVPNDQSPEAVRHALDQAERDPDPRVRRIATSLRATYDKAPTTTSTTK